MFVKKIKTETKKQKGDFIGLLLGTLRASLLGNMLAGKRVLTAGKETNRAEQGF